MPKTSFFAMVKNSALFYGAGAIGALQALNFDIFSFPPLAHLYLKYSLSFIAIICVFLGGGTLVDIIKNISNLSRKIKEVDQDNNVKNTNNEIT